MENENAVRSVRAVYVELVLKNCPHAPHMENNYVKFRWNFKSFILVHFRLEVPNWNFKDSIIKMSNDPG